MVPSVRVCCHSGWRGEETPRSFFLGEREIPVREVLVQWRDPEYRWFKVLGDDGARYVLRRDDLGDTWELQELIV